MQVKTVLDSGRDGLFAVLNGGRSVAAPAIIQKKLPDLLTSEFSAQGAEPKTKDTPPNLQYLTHTFLAAHQYVYNTIILLWISIIMSQVVGGDRVLLRVLIGTVSCAHAPFQKTGTECGQCR